MAKLGNGAKESSETLSMPCLIRSTQRALRSERGKYYPQISRQSAKGLMSAFGAKQTLGRPGRNGRLLTHSGHWESRPNVILPVPRR